MVDSMTVNAYDYNAKDGMDSTVAFQKAIDNAIITGRCVEIPPGRFRISAPLIIGTLDSKKQTYVSFRGAGELVTFLDWVGPENETAIKLSLNKYFECSNFSIKNIYSKKGNIGISLGGPLGNGTQTLCGRFKNIGIANFDIGIRAGDLFGNASSEIRYENCSFQYNNIGWESRDFNTLNHLFIMPQFTDNNYGMMNRTSNVSIVGGSASNQKEVDIYTENRVSLSVRDFRAESAKHFFRSESAGNVLLDNCVIVNTQDSNKISIDASRSQMLRIVGCDIDGFIQFRQGGNFILDGNLLRPDNGVPFKIGPSNPGVKFCIKSRLNLERKENISFAVLNDFNDTIEFRG